MRATTRFVSVLQQSMAFSYLSVCPGVGIKLIILMDQCLVVIAIFIILVVRFPLVRNIGRFREDSWTISNDFATLLSYNPRSTLTLDKFCSRYVICLGPISSFSYFGWTRFDCVYRLHSPIFA